MTKIVLFFLILTPFFIMGQDVVFEDNDQIITGPISSDYSGLVTYEEEKNYFLLNFLKDDFLRTCIYDNEFRLIENMLIEKENSLEYNTFVESYGSNKKHVFIYRKKSGRKFYAISVDFENNLTFQKSLDFKLKGEDFLSTFSQGDKFYVISKVEDSRLLRLHILDVDLKYQIEEIDINKSEFYLNGKRLPAMPPLRVGMKDPVFHFPKFSGNSLLTALSSNKPLSNDLITAANKFYVRPDQVIMTLDFDDDQNIVIEINLNDYSTVLRKTLKISDEKFSTSNTKSNSFLLDDKLFLFKGNKKTLYLRILNRADNTLLHQDSYDLFLPYLSQENLMVKLSDFLTYKQEGEEQQSVRKKFSKLVKAKDRMGLRVSEGNNSYRLSFGVFGTRNISVPIVSAAVSPALVVGAGINFTFNKENSLDFYLNKPGYELTYDTFKNHYDLMDDYLNEKYDDKVKKSILWKVFFKKGANHFAGYYDKADEKFYLRKFN
ncbi:MAG: hypothetical protein ED555_07035 [Allomuricauda sp.]|nr:MAG: hypothetical protein ED555_07035 [Allomuricauda sp.]